MKIVKTIILILLLSSTKFAAADNFTQKDRELLIELKIKVQEIDKRFEQIDKRFEQIDKRFEQIDKRFEQINIRFSDMFTFLWIITGIFVTLTGSVIGFAYWDRRTIIKKAKEEAIQEIEKEGRLKDLINAFRRLAKDNPEIAKVLKQFNIL